MAGRKGKYERWLTDEGLVLVEGWARDGLLDTEIAYNMGINPATLYEWKKRFPELNEALKKGKDVVDRIVENALLKCALGYEYDERIEELNAETGELVVTKVNHRVVQPNTTAQIFWLKNRKPDQYRDKRENVVEVQDAVEGGAIVLAEVVQDE